MSKGFIRVYCGEGKGKTTAAIGFGLQVASQGDSVIIIQCLKNRNEEEIQFLQRLEPEIKLFRFEKSAGSFNDLTEEEKKEEILNIKNGMNFAKKVLTTGGCKVLILDEVLGLLDNEVITVEELKNIISAKDEETILILTGRNMCPKLVGSVDEILKIDIIKASTL